MGARKAVRNSSSFREAKSWRTTWLNENACVRVSNKYCLLQVYEEFLLIHSPDNYLFSIYHEQTFAGEIDSSYFLGSRVKVRESQGADPLVGRWDRVANCIVRVRASHLDLGIVSPAIIPPHRLHLNPSCRSMMQRFLWLILDLKGRWEQKFCFIGKNIFSRNNLVFIFNADSK